MSINRNKESLTLNLKHPDARGVLEGLLEKADVLVENFRPGTMERMGLGYPDLSPRWPGLVYCSVSGFGQTGPRRSEPGYDAVMQGEGGLMSITGPGDGPAYRLGIAIADITSGMFAAYGVAMALLARHRTGKGQFVDIGMLDSVAALLTYQAGIYFATDRAPTRMGNRHPTIVPYETARSSRRRVRRRGRQRTALAVVQHLAGTRGADRRPSVRHEPGPGRAPRRTQTDSRRNGCSPRPQRNGPRY